MEGIGSLTVEILSLKRKFMAAVNSMARQRENNMLSPMQ